MLNPFSRVRWTYRQRRVWRLPAAIVAAALLLAWAVPAVDRALAEELRRVPVAGTFDAGVMATVLSSVASGTITFSGFVFSVVLLVIQFGTGSMSARLSPRLTQDWVVGAALGTFMATFTYTLLISVRLGTRVEDYEPVLSSIVAIGLALASVGLFFALLTRVVNFLRLVKSLEYMARTGARTAAEVHPEPFDAHHVPDPDPESPDRVIRYAGTGGVLLGIDTGPVTALAAAAACRITLVPAIGDFVLPGAALFAIHGNGVDERKLRRHVVFGIERVVDADPAFALRVMVDIALKALSPAVNDPTTAVQALDHIGALLVELSGRDLGVRRYRDRAGVERLRLRNSDWIDYLSLAVDEIRYYGADSLQVTRRLRALYTDLLRLCPPQRRPPVEQRLAALDADVPAAFRTALDRAIAAEPDWQGLGGPTIAEAAS
ncbi:MULTISPECIES: DUF2254 domain-containing protein [unclassified Nocardia]|uniref:DUF2254 domain-containing protein n=1 Tax=unclassified Nocardia TaxID=2637762 RepID=UPI001CE3CA91|nr:MULTISPECIES: DUF2254 domain-containing protein [unclassified Nocardia]